MQTKTIPYVSMVIYVAHHLLNPVKPDKWYDSQKKNDFLEQFLETLDKLF